MTDSRVDMNTTTLKYIEEETDGRNLNIDTAIEFLCDIDPLSISIMEIEMCIMHAAFLVCDKNVFNNNYNVRPAMKKTFIDHVSMILDSDLVAWTRKTYDFSFWNEANRQIANLVYNWVSGSIDNPRKVIL